MFTGIVESIGKVKDINKRNNSILLKISSSISKDLIVNQSISHNGVCLTILGSNHNYHEVEMVNE